MIKRILTQSAFWLVNKHIAKFVGLDASILLSSLVSKFEYFNTEWFYCTANDILKETTLSYFKQKAAQEELMKHGLIEIRREGMPAKLYFKINEENILRVLNTSIEETLNQQLEKLEINNSNNLNTYNKNNEIISDEIREGKEPKNSTLFDDGLPAAGEKVLFRNSIYHIKENFMRKFQAEIQMNIDVEYYFHAVSDWSDAANKRRTAAGWIATARSFMRGDKDKNKLKKLETADFDEAAKRFLNL